MKIIHIIERFSSAGPERSIIALAKYAAQLGLWQEHIVCTLEKAGSPVAVIKARQAGVQVLLGLDLARRTELLTQADIVLIHFWNNPALYEFLRSPMPPMRLAIWLKILGGHLPQVIPDPLLDFADLVVATTPGTLHLPAFAERAEPTPVVYGVADFSRLDGFTPQPHAGYTVGTIGSTLDATKLHPAFVAMSASVQIPDVRFIVCGGGGKPLRQQAHALGAADRFDFRGYVEEIRAVLEVCDVFGYPLCADTYATSEKALQEAMWVGVPPVVFPHAGVRYLVEDGVTGLVVESEADYTAALEWLHCHPNERRRLGRNALEYARRAFAPQRAVSQFAELFNILMAHPKQARVWPDDGANPAEWFIAALGDHTGPFSISYTGKPGPQLDAADASIAAASDLLLHGEGGIIHYRNRWPGDPHLRLWTGLALAHRGEHERAGQEFQAAAALGIDRAGALPPERWLVQNGINSSTVRSA
jgi:glycosyltransferase involved in cell wall biosynthesis